jgi:hypothetical protein
MNFAKCLKKPGIFIIYHMLNVYAPYFFSQAPRRLIFSEPQAAFVLVSQSGTRRLLEERRLLVEIR